MSLGHLWRLAAILAVLLAGLPSSQAVAATNYGNHAIVLAAGTNCWSVRAHYRTPPNTAATIDLNVWGYRESIPPLCARTAPWVAFGASQLSVQAQLWSTDGTFCTETSTKVVPAGAAGSGYGWGKSWNRSGNCQTATEFAVHGVGIAPGGASNTSVVVFNA